MRPLLVVTVRPNLSLSKSNFFSEKMFRFITALVPLLLFASAAPRPQVFGQPHHDLVLTKITNQSHEAALAAHQAAENAVRAAAGQVQSIRHIQIDFF